MAIVIGTLCSCSATTTEPIHYTDFDHLDHWDQLNDLTDDRTLLFYYSPHCAICKSIESEVAPLLFDLKSRGIVVFLINEGMIYQQGTPPLELIEVPSILIYQGQTYLDIVSGSKPVLEFLDSEMAAER